MMKRLAKTRKNLTMTYYRDKISLKWVNNIHTFCGSWTSSASLRVCVCSPLVPCSELGPKSRSNLQNLWNDHSGEQKIELYYYVAHIFQSVKYIYTQENFIPRWYGKLSRTPFFRGKMRSLHGSTHRTASNYLSSFHLNCQEKVPPCRTFYPIQTIL